MYKLCMLGYFYKIDFLKKFYLDHDHSVKQFGYRSVLSNVLLVLIWVQNACKGYQLLENVAASKERIKTIG